MKPIIGLAVIAVAGLTLGTGFLNNDIELWIQQFGVGSGDISTPTDHAYVDFNIIQVQGTDGFFKNVINLCEVTPEDDIGVLFNEEVPPKANAAAGDQNHITCKFTDLNDNIIAEGTVWADFYPGGEVVSIPIEDADLNSLIPVGAVHDVIVVIQAETHADAEGNLP